MYQDDLKFLNKDYHTQQPSQVKATTAVLVIDRQLSVYLSGIWLPGGTIQHIEQDET